MPDGMGRTAGTTRQALPTRRPLEAECPTNEPEPLHARLLQEALETMLLAVVLFVAVRSTLQNTVVDGPSMLPNLNRGQRIMVSKLAYRLTDPRRGEVVVLANPRGEGPALIKRIVGLPGETIEIVDGQVLSDGRRLDEPYLVYDRGDSDWGPRILGGDEYFVLGDNRNNSNDSRSFGPVKESLFIGKAWFSIWPPSPSLVFPSTGARAAATVSQPTTQP